MSHTLHFVLALLMLVTAPALAGNAAPDTTDLARDPHWLTLVHYQPDRFGSGHTSEADDPGFFFSPEGRHSPAAELKATLAAIRQPVSAFEDPDDHPRCRFPARDQWLREQLDLARGPIECDAYRQWLEELNTESVTLVFAASYLNSPSSMFGHTFLRLDPPEEDGETNLLLANTISYAADAAERDNELLFAYKGIFGGYPGITSIQPYYEKVRLYSDIEHRDLWEYRLNLNPEEVGRMLAHAWEIRDRNFDYFFLDENCAYRLLALIDVARPGTDLLDEVSTHAIPSDTVRWVVDRDLVADVHYRPSASTSVNFALDQLPPEHRLLASAIAQGYVDVDASEVASLPPAQRARLLDAVYDYVRYQSEAQGWPREHAAPLSHDLLTTRSRIDDVPPAAEPPRPRVRDDQGHGTGRVTLSGGRIGDRNFTQLTLRGAYHDLLDPPAGYRNGAQLQFLRLDARYYTDNDELQVEEFTGVEIRSLSHRNRFFSPLSWQVGFGARRTRTGNNRVLTPYLDGGAGFSWQLGLVTALALGTADLEIDDDLDKGYDAAPGADIGLLHQSNRFSLMTGLRSKAWAVGSRDRQDELYVDGNWHLGQDFSISGRFSREHHFDRYQNTWQLGVNAYF